MITLCIKINFLLVGMIGYGLAKAGVHQLVNSLAQPDSGLPAGATVLAILPYDGLISSLLIFITSY